MILQDGAPQLESLVYKPHELVRSTLDKEIQRFSKYKFIKII